MSISVSSTKMEAYMQKVKEDHWSHLMKHQQEKYLQEHTKKQLALKASKEKYSETLKQQMAEVKRKNRNEIDVSN